MDKKDFPDWCDDDVINEILKAIEELENDAEMSEKQT